MTRVVVRFHSSFASGEFWTFCLLQMKLRPAFSPSAKSFRARAVTKDDIGEDFVMTLDTSQRLKLVHLFLYILVWREKHFHCIVDPKAVQAFLHVCPNFQWQMKSSLGQPEYVFA